MLPPTLQPTSERQPLSPLPGTTTHCLVLAQLPPPIHGVTLTTQRVVEALQAADGMEVETLWAGSARDLSDINRRTFAKYLQFARLNLRAARKWIAGTRYDLAYGTLVPWAHTAFRDAIVAWWAKRLARRALVHLHGEGLETIVSGKALRARVLRSLLRGSELIAITEAAASTARCSGLFARVHKLPNTAPDPGPQQRPPGLPIRIGHIANLDPRKGVLRFVDAMEAMAASGLPVSGEIAGASTSHLTLDDLDRIIAERGLEDRITVRGPVTGTAKSDFFRSLDALLYLSAHDHAPIVLVEAMSYGLVPIALDTGGVAEMCGPDFAQHVFPAGMEPAELNASIREIFATYAGNLELLAKDRRKARDRFIAEYSEASNHDRLQAVLLGSTERGTGEPANAMARVRSTAPAPLKQAMFAISRKFHTQFLSRPLPRRMAICFHALEDVDRQGVACCVKTLRDLGYRCVSMDEYLDPSTTGRVLNISFDDNYRSWFQSLTWLDKLGLQATFFTNTLPISAADEPAALEAYYGRLYLAERGTPLNGSELAAIARAGHEIGGHSHSHFNLAQLPREQWEAEIVGNKAILEDIIGREVRHFAWPYGMARHMTAEQRSFALDVGFHSVAAATPGMLYAGIADKSSIPRSGWRTQLPRDANLAALAIDGRIFTALTGRSVMG
jgi:glycosyltransferase involved in cell wall biosynthesis/peptidoglycan/xylan/chitin deacetylase (PgdA/CDA1 family)